MYSGSSRISKQLPITARYWNTLKHRKEVYDKVGQRLFQIEATFVTTKWGNFYYKVWDPFYYKAWYNLVESEWNKARYFENWKAKPVK